MSDAVYVLDLFGVVVFAVSGSLAAGRKSMDLFGVLVLALVTALGGGTLRDLLLQNGPVFWVDDHIYLIVVLAAALLTFVIVRLLPVPRQRWLLVFDAFGLAVFTVVGAAKALDADTASGVAIVMGVMTGVAGGMLRDVLSAEVPLVLRKEIYAIASLCGAIAYVVMAALGAPYAASVVVSIVVTLGIRLAAMRWGLSLPLFVHRKQG